MVAMYKSGDLLGSLYTGHWHEAISVGSAATLRDGDYMAPIHRDLGAHLCRGMEPWQVMASFMGKATSPTGGRDGTLALRSSRSGYLQPAQPHSGELSRRDRNGVCGQVPGRGSGVPRLLRRRLHIPRGLPRGAEHGRGADVAVHLRGREQSVRLLHPGQHADGVAGLRRKGRGVRISRCEGGRHGRARRLRRGQ